MDRIKQRTLDDFISGRFHWKSLPPHNQMQVCKELKFLRECIDADIDSSIPLVKSMEKIEGGVSQLIRDFKIWMESFNVITHRTSNDQNPR